MALNQADFAEYTSRRTTITLQRPARLNALVGQNHSGEVSGEGGMGNSTVIAIPDFSTISPTATTYNGSNFDAAWGNAVELGAFQIPYQVNRQVREHFAIRNFDYRNLSYDLFSQGMQRQTNAMMNTINDGIAAYLNALTNYTTFAPGTSDTPQETGTTARNNNAGNIFNYGDIGSSTSVGIGTDSTEANYLRVATSTSDGSLATSTQAATFGQDILDALGDLRARANYTNIINGEPIGGMPGGLWAVAHPAVWEAVFRGLADKGLPGGLTQLADSWYTDSLPNIFRPMEQGGGMVGVWQGIMLLSDKSPGLVQTAGCPLFVGTNAALEMRVDPVMTQMFTPTTHPVAPLYEIRQQTYWGIQLVNSHLLMKGLVRGIG